jgi:hypothetical protein
MKFFNKFKAIFSVNCETSWLGNLNLKQIFSDYLGFKVRNVRAHSLYVQL